MFKVIQILLISCLFVAANEKVNFIVDDYYPFVTKGKDNTYRGFDIDLLKMLSKENGWKYDITYVNNVSQILKKVKEDETNIGISGISITAERERSIDFSTPYFDSSLGILLSTKIAKVSIWEKTKKTSPIIIKALIVFICLLLVFGHLIWFFERNNGDNENFHERYDKGVADGYWFSFIGSTTVGFGDKVPKTFMGKICAIIIIVIGMTWYSVFTGNIVSVMHIISTNSVSFNLNNLKNKNVGVKIGSTSADMLLDYDKINRIEFNNLDEMISAFEKGEIDSIFYDSPALERYAIQNTDIAVMSDKKITKQQYGLVLQTNSPYREQINEFILTIKEDGRYDKLYNKWFSE